MSAPTSAAPARSPQSSPDLWETGYSLTPRGGQSSSRLNNELDNYKSIRDSIRFNQVVHPQVNPCHGAPSLEASACRRRAIPATCLARLRRWSRPYIGGEPACRPGSVPALSAGGGHPSRTAVADSLVRSTRGHRAGSPQTLAQAPKGPLDLAPGGVYLAVSVTCDAGGLLHHRFTLTFRPWPKGGLFSVALSRGSPRVGVTDHLAVWSPDLPHRTRRSGATARPTHPQTG